MKAIDKAITTIDPDTKFNDEELAIEIRQRITEENDAINSYLSLIPHITDSAIKKVINDIADEEKVHVGELQKLLYELDPTELEKEKEGHKENV